jgi:ATP-dependent helicase HrpB
MPPDSTPSTAAGALLAWAYPDRIARRRQGQPGRFLLSNGRGATLPLSQPLSASDYIVAASLDGQRQNARIFLAAGYDETTLQDQFKKRLQQKDLVDWDPQRKIVTTNRTLNLNALTIRTDRLKHADPEQVAAALIFGIRQEGIDCLPWTKAIRQWQARMQFAMRWPEGRKAWPDVSDRNLEQTLESWLGPFIGGIFRLRDLGGVDLKGALTGFLTWHQQKRLDRLAPTHWTVPSGSRIPIDYGNDPPVLAVRLQEMFGLTVTPAVAEGRQPLLIHLHSPAGRPVQVTQDLAGFWESGYIEIKKELKGRYPKHYWPDDPLKATPTNRAKSREANRGTGRQR